MSISLAGTTYLRDISMPKSIVGNLKHLQINHKQLPGIGTSLPDPILIVGMHNSGTSILAKIINGNGVFLGSNMEHHESHFFSIFINDLMILGGESKWANLPIMDVNQVMSFKDTVGPFIRDHWIAEYLQWGYDAISPWGIKDPRLCVLLPLYLEIFPKAKVVHIRRDPNDVAASLCKRKKRGVGVVDQFDHWKKLTLEYTKRVDEYANKCHAYHEILYEDFCTNSTVTTKQLFDFIGLTFNENTEAMLKEVTPSRIGSYKRRKLKRFFR